MFFVKQKTAYELRISDWSSDVCSSDLFCAVDLSAFYFDIRKDSLYCDAPDAARRRAAQTALDALFDCLTAWLAPLLRFTAEEAWLARNADAPGEDRRSVAKGRSRTDRADPGGSRRSKKKKKP